MKLTLRFTIILKFYIQIFKALINKGHGSGYTTNFSHIDFFTCNILKRVLGVHIAETTPLTEKYSMLFKDQVFGCEDSKAYIVSSRVHAIVKFTVLFLFNRL
jgi:hypothetical protein